MEEATSDLMSVSELEPDPISTQPWLSPPRALRPNLSPGGTSKQPPLTPPLTTSERVAAHLLVDGLLRGDDSAGALYASVNKDADHRSDLPRSAEVWTILREQHERAPEGILGGDPTLPSCAPWSVVVTCLLRLLHEREADATQHLSAREQRRQREEAQRLHREAHAMNARGEHSGARHAFEASYLLEPRPSVLVSLANMLLKEGRLHAARALYDGLLGASCEDGSSSDADVTRRRLHWDSPGEDPPPTPANLTDDDEDGAYAVDSGGGGSISAAARRAAGANGGPPPLSDRAREVAQRKRAECAARVVSEVEARSAAAARSTALSAQVEAYDSRLGEVRAAAGAAGAVTRACLATELQVLEQETVRVNQVCAAAKSEAQVAIAEVARAAAAGEAAQSWVAAAVRAREAAEEEAAAAHRRAAAAEAAATGAAANATTLPSSHEGGTESERREAAMAAMAQEMAGLEAQLAAKTSNGEPVVASADVAAAEEARAAAEEARAAAEEARSEAEGARAAAETRCTSLQAVVDETHADCLDLSKALASSRKAQKQLQAQLKAAEKRAVTAEQRLAGAGGG